MNTSLFVQEPSRLGTPGFDGFSVKFDPFTGRFLACASSANFGMKGPGRLWIYEHQLPQHAPKTYDLPEGIYDVAWSESSPTVLAAAMADGGVAIFDLKVPNVPVRIWKEHHRECSCVDWNGISKDRFWNAEMKSSGSMRTIKSHDGLVYQASWSPREANLLISVGSDRCIRLWDERSPNGPVKVLSGAHDNEILSVDWNKWDPMQFATGSVDLSIRIWDWRISNTPSSTLRGHSRAVKKVKWSPFSGGVLFSVGYDMIARVWDLKSLNPMVGVWEGHSEFVTGIDISLYDPSLLLATCAWDQSVHLLRPPHWGQHLGLS